MFVVSLILASTGHHRTTYGSEQGREASATTSQTSTASQSEVIQADDEPGDLLEGLDLDSSPEEIPTIPDASKPNRQPQGVESKKLGQLESLDPLFEAFRSMQRAEQLLTSGQADDNVLAAQQRAVELLDELLKQQNDSQSKQRSASETEQEIQQRDLLSKTEENQPAPDQNQQTSTEQSNSANGDPQQNTSNAAAEKNGPGDRREMSEEQQQPVPAGADTSPLNASGQAIWGHLPQKTRGMLRAEIPTDYLPSYATQISEYFKALAEMPSEP